MNPILGVDFGRARIGLAISDELRLLAHPLATIPFGEDAIGRIVELVQKRKIDCVVVGVPKLMSGKMGAAAEEIPGKSGGAGEADSNAAAIGQQ